MNSITTVELRSTVRLAHNDDELTIGDVAAINGPQAIAIQALPIKADQEIISGRWTLILVQSIRDLIKHAPGIHAGSIVIVGTDLSITRRSVAQPDPISLNTNNLKTQPPMGTVLRDHLERWVYARLKSDADSTRIQFSDRDLELLGSPTADRIVEIAEIGRSTKMNCRIVMYEQERIITDTTIRFDVQIQRRVRVTSAQIRRNQIVTAEQSAIETRWLSPTTPIADPDTSLGKECKLTIDPGSILLVSMLEAPVLVERGSMVSARSLAGTVSVTMSVRALDNGRLGDVIELESRDRKQRFTARVAGPGRVVIVQNPQTTTRGT